MVRTMIVIIILSIFRQKYPSPHKIGLLGFTLLFNIMIHGVNVIGSNHYEKTCMQKCHYHVTITLRQLFYNYITIIPWKYRELKNKRSRYKILEFFCSCILVLRLYIDECTHHTYNFGQPLFDFYW